MTMLASLPSVSACEIEPSWHFFLFFFFWYKQRTIPWRFFPKDVHIID